MNHFNIKSIILTDIHRKFNLQYSKFSFLFFFRNAWQELSWSTKGAKEYTFSLVGTGSELSDFEFTRNVPPTMGSMNQDQTLNQWAPVPLLISYCITIYKVDFSKVFFAKTALECDTLFSGMFKKKTLYWKSILQTFYFKWEWDDSVPLMFLLVMIQQ